MISHTDIQNNNCYTGAAALICLCVLTQEQIDTSYIVTPITAHYEIYVCVWVCVRDYLWKTQVWISRLGLEEQAQLLLGGFGGLPME